MELVKKMPASESSSLPVTHTNYSSWAKNHLSAEPSRFPYVLLARAVCATRMAASYARLTFLNSLFKPATLTLSSLFLEHQQSKNQERALLSFR